jgi:riboflavin synthase
MFTGLIEHVGVVERLATQPGGGARLSVRIGPLAAGTAVGDSIAIDGCCLTVTDVKGPLAVFDAVPESLRRTTLGERKAGDSVNLERALASGQRMGGHFVQGHIDGTAVVERTVPGEHWAEWHFRLQDAALVAQIVEKGSIAIDGISLTVAGCDGEGRFWVALIPETLKRTTLSGKDVDARVNIETDIIGKYVLAFLARGKALPSGGLTEERLRELGY